LKKQAEWTKRQLKIDDVRVVEEKLDQSNNKKASNKRRYFMEERMEI